MSEEQTALIASFGGFVDAIKSQLANADSYHIGIVTSDDYSGNASGCQTIGSLVTQTVDANSSVVDCLPFSSGKRFMDETEPDLAAKFACAANVGVAGDGDERMMLATTNAVSTTTNAPGACNDGFLRDDALLVLVLITDEDDAPDCVPFFGCVGGGSPGSPPEWAETIVQRKGGVQGNVVVLGIAGDQGNSCGADYSQRVIAFLNWFTNRSLGDICAPSYEQFFTDAISVIDTACDEFTPPG
jgi:hypothetical protein